jgi:glycosyltransferase involved in cell wall biosynthesis
MKISIIVPAFNEEKLISQTLASIREAAAVFSEFHDEFELIVCDNNSTDRTASLAKEQGARVVFEPINQIARARNTGAAAASGDWFLFIDADSKPSRDLIRAVANAIHSGRCIGGGAVIRPDEPILAVVLITHLWNCVSRVKRWVAGSFVFCEAAAFRELGGFSQQLFATEEIEFSIRLKCFARGQKRKVIIIHKFPLITSVRKIHLYSAFEHARFLVKAALRPRSVLRKRDACGIWYDGRR